MNRGMDSSSCAVPASEGTDSLPNREALPVAKMRVLDLFSGIGGFSLGLERAGFETAAFCEISAKCRHLLNHHWPEVPAYDDICTLTAERLRADGIAVDAICGGFPCQDISFAGKGAGLAGERSGLWREYARLIRELRPRLVFVENVSALLGRGLGDVLGDLAALGYDAWWDCIPASAVGAPHRRDRLWLVAYPRSLEHQGYGDAFRRAIAEKLSRSDHVADADSSAGRERRFGLRRQAPTGEPGERRQDMAHPDGARLEGLGAYAHSIGWQIPRLGQAGLCNRAGNEPGWWATEPDVGRVAHGVPARVDRLHGLGNAVVPEIPYRLGKAALNALASLAQQKEAA